MYICELCMHQIDDRWNKVTIGIHSRVEKEDEMSCLIEGCNFLLKNIPDEAFLYQRHTEPTYKFQGVSRDIFPFLLVNIGSGVSLIKVNAYLFVSEKVL